MRITDKTTTSNAIYNINEGRIRLDRLNEASTTGRVVNRPSDDPVASKKILDVETQIKASKQYISNIKTGQTWLDMAGTSLEGMLSSVMSIKGAASQAAGAISDPVKKEDILSQLKAFRDQLTDYPSSQVGGQYVFSGFNSDKPPFSATTRSGFTTTVGNPNITNVDTTDFYIGMPITGPDIPPDTVVSAFAGVTVTMSNNATNSNTAGTLTFTGKFQGTEDILSIEVNKGVQVPISVSGGAVLRGSGTPPGDDIIKAIDTLIADVNSGNLAGISAANVAFDKANQQMLGAISDIGMRKARMDNALASQQRNSNALTEIHDNMQNIDYAKVAIELTNQKTAFDAALASTAKIAPLSLLNYL